MSQNNFFLINNVSALNEIFKTCGNKLLCLMICDKNNLEYRRAKKSFIDSSEIYQTSIFALVDLENFEGDSEYIMKPSPMFTFYHNGHVLGTSTYTNSKAFENDIKQCEKNVCMQNSLYGPAISMGINPQQVQQHIWANASNNPTLMQQLQMNPNLIHQMTQNYIQQLMQQNTNNNITPQHIAPQIVPPNNVSHIEQLAHQIQNDTGVGSLVPTMQQLQYTLQIFKMLQQQDLLNINKIEQLPREESITLPNGDRIVALDNNKYGLIRKKY